MIHITVNLFGQYRENRFKSEKRIYQKGITASNIIKELGITKDIPLGILMVNSCHKAEDYILQEGDILALFPKVGGG